MEREKIENTLTVSVVIPTYNRIGPLLEALESVFAQTLPPQEILVIDDGSTDDTAERLKEFGDRIRYIRQQNRGPSAARNLGILKAQGEWIAFLDSDDIWLPEYLERQFESIRKDPGLSLVASAYSQLNMQENLLRPVVEKNISDANLVERLFIKNFFGTSSLMVRRKCFSSVGGFNEEMRFGEDWDMWLRIVAAFRGAYMETPLVRVRKHYDSITGAEGEANFRTWEKILETYRHHPLVKWRTWRKARAWYLFNLSYHFYVLQNRVSERRYLAQSLVAWPFSYLKRYIALGRTFCGDEVYFRLRRRILGR